LNLRDARVEEEKKMLEGGHHEEEGHSVAMRRVCGLVTLLDVQNAVKALR